jgi:hypothetical protein
MKIFVCALYISCALSIEKYSIYLYWSYVARLQGQRNLFANLCQIHNGQFWIRCGTSHHHSSSTAWWVYHLLLPWLAEFKSSFGNRNRNQYIANFLRLCGFWVNNTSEQHPTSSSKVKCRGNMAFWNIIPTYKTTRYYNWENTIISSPLWKLQNLYGSDFICWMAFKIWQSILWFKIINNTIQY